MALLAVPNQPFKSQKPQPHTFISSLTFIIFHTKLNHIERALSESWRARSKTPSGGLDPRLQVVETVTSVNFFFIQEITK
jgi:hypothetical protein